jgi:hypothetical protein
MPNRQTLLVDFDGVIHDYQGWNGVEPIGQPIAKSRAALLLLEKTYRIVIFTTRPAENVERWLRHYGFPDYKVTDKKEPAYLIIDDRAITFNGIWSDWFITQITNFSPHWQKVGHVEVPEEIPTQPATEST